MSSYMTTSEIKERVNYDKDDFNLETAGFDDLLEQVEEESRALIESYKGDITFSQETRVQTIKSSDDSGIPLEFPVNDITSSGVEYKKTLSDDWTELEEDRWDYSEHNLILRKLPRTYSRYHRNRRYDPVQIDHNRTTWSEFSTKIRVTYDRGYSDIPANVINIQLTLINKILRQLKHEQGISGLDPQNVSTYADIDILMTQDVRERLDEITDARNFVRVI